MQPLYNIVASNAFPTLFALYIFALRVEGAQSPSPIAKGVRCELTITKMADMTMQDFVALEKLSRNNEDGYGWHTAIWWIFAVLVAIFLLWWCNKQGDGKADLAAEISQINGKLNTLEPVVKNNAEQNFKTATALAGIVQGVQDIKDYTYDQINALDNAVFKSRFHSGGCGCGNGRGGQRFIQKSTYGTPTITAEVVEECTQC